MIGVLQRLKNLIPMNAKLRIYKTAVLPHLTYCSLVWLFCRASDRNKLERINERGLRTVFKDRVSPYGDPRGGGVLPYMGYIGMCRCGGYGFQAVYSRIGYINQSV